MELLATFIANTSAAGSGSMPNAAIGAFIATGLPILVIFLLGQRATSAFYHGWRPGFATSGMRRFRVSKIWRTIFIFFNVVILAAAAPSWFERPPIFVLAVFGSLVWLGFTLLVVLIFRSFVEITPNVIIYRFGFKTHKLEMVSVKRAYAANLLLLLEIKEGGAIPLPLICIENISELASCLYENLHKA